MHLFTKLRVISETECEMQTPVFTPERAYRKETAAEYFVFEANKVQSDVGGGRWPEQ